MNVSPEGPAGCMIARIDCVGGSAKAGTAILSEVQKR